MLDLLWEYLHYPFVRYAIICGMLIALCSSLLGVSLVLKRYSFIGDGLSHVAFGVMAVAGVLHLNNDMFLVLPLTILCAVLLLKNGKNMIVKGDSAIAMISVGALALGYLLMNLFPVSGNLSGDVCTSLFGSTSILTLKKSEVILCFALCAVVVLVFVLFSNKIFAVTFDEDFAKASGVNVDLINLVLAIITACVIVLAMNLVGSLLISALLVFPTLSAMRLYQSYRNVVISSAFIAVLSALFGILVSILFSTPVGSTIVAFNILVFGICCMIGGLKK